MRGRGGSEGACGARPRQRPEARADTARAAPALTVASPQRPAEFLEIAAK